MTATSRTRERAMTARKTLTNADPLLAVLGMHVYYASPKLATTVDAAIRSAIRATIPGRQQKKNLEPLVKKARAAFVRTLRRRARA